MAWKSKMLIKHSISKSKKNQISKVLESWKVEFLSFWGVKKIYISIKHLSLQLSSHFKCSQKEKVSFKCLKELSYIYNYFMLFQHFILCKKWKHVKDNNFNSIQKNCYKSVQRFRVTCLFTGQYDTREYGTIAGAI